MVKMVQNTTLYQLSFLQTEIQMTSRKLSYKQVLTSRDKILSIPATENIKKQQSTFAKISPANFENTSIALNDDFIAEATEYTFNPFQMNSNDKIATNIFEINLYNQNKTVTTNEVTKVEVKDLKVPIEFSFPASDN
jgi:cyclopropane fatty-acyl-phospholipid synthase-like methyltransferase